MDKRDYMKMALEFAEKGLAPEIPKFFPKNSYSIGKSIRRAIISNKFKIV